MRRSSMKFNAVMVQSTLPNMIITMLSIKAGSYPAWLLTRPILPKRELLREIYPKPMPWLLPI